MHHNENSMKKGIFSASLAALLVVTLATASIMAGCGKDDDGDKTETKVVTETQVVTKLVDGVYTDENGSIISDTTSNTTADATEKTTAKNSDNNKATTQAAENSEKSEKSENADNSGNSSNGGNSSNNSSNNNSGNQNSGKTKGEISGYGGLSNAPAVKSNASNSSSNQSGQDHVNSAGSGYEENSKTLNIEGKVYNIGDTVTCTYYVKLGNEMINYQGYITYDGQCLKAKSAELMKPASSGGLTNVKLDQEIRFNGVKLGGYDYIDGGEFLVVEYEVVGGGKSSPSFKWEVVTDIDNNKCVASDGTGTNGLELTCTYS